MKTFVVTLAVLACVGTFESVNAVTNGMKLLSSDGSYIPGNAH